ncbi:uncharacterized protein AMSG_02793 [Thecamonas trahens ATCC 50062]|uniref:DNA-directed DNA polymerase family A palm domain-containing protein n=1 Tax=Thecamonas trahens ATCC 50062 TaxID=461836 RepID=A0A0L0D2B6_THETB|nr:hypothetical protein AMSG_02793 [Thecamonas trahens ATCC 50062]KNC46341.1 hypothetical protein AMSG_02793 [Thecamonas trahens ATCC 50062]|eukprot:XP_013760634.1 hypothetical protein AMSG_02793 [Thecamonas trahens ATCC 50062]
MVMLSEGSPSACHAMDVAQFAHWLGQCGEIKFVVAHALSQYTKLRHALAAVSMQAESLWLEIVNRGFISDVVLLDGLLQLAGSGSIPLGASLDELVHRALALDVSADWDIEPRTLFDAAKVRVSKVADDKQFMALLAGMVGACTTNADMELPELSHDQLTAMTALIFNVHYIMDCKAVDVMNECCFDRNHSMFQHAVDSWGPLSEVIQIKGAVALQDATLNGIAVDPRTVAALYTRLQATIQEHCAYIQAHMPLYRIAFQYERVGAGANGETAAKDDPPSASETVAGVSAKVASAVGTLPSDVVEATSDDDGEEEKFENATEKAAVSSLFSLSIEEETLMVDEAESDGWQLSEAPLDEISFLTTDTGKPRMSRAGTRKALVRARREALAAVVDKRRAEREAAGLSIEDPPLLTRDEEYKMFSLPRDGSDISVRMKKWARFAHLSEFVARYCTIIEYCKLFDIVAPLHEMWTALGKPSSAEDEGVAKGTRDLRPQPLGAELMTVHPRYVAVMRNGRTATFEPHLQGTPSMPGFRECYVARPGAVLLTVDYSFIELCTLAAVCEARYGQSVLADVIRNGVDPHAFTAAVCDDMSLPEFEAQKHSSDEATRARYKYLRQRAKAINFGLPGGQGARSLREYAASFGVSLTYPEAKELRRQFTNEVFPEIGMYLNEQSLVLLASNLRRSLAVVRRKLRYHLAVDGEADTLGKSNLLDIKSVVRGRPFRRDGLPYSQKFVANIWASLRKLNRNPKLTPLLADRQLGSDEVYDALFRQSVVTLTGRVRGCVNFTQARNTPFSGLAADGAKLALWDLFHSGYRIVGFVHDEIIVELPETSDLDRHVAEIRAIAEHAMAPLCADIPIQTAFTLSYRWHKSQEPVHAPNGKLVPSDSRDFVPTLATTHMDAWNAGKMAHVRAAPADAASTQ